MARRIMESPDKYVYFIIEDGYDRGKICYTEEGQNYKSQSEAKTLLRVHILGKWEMSLKCNAVKILKRREAEFLLALDDDKNRLAAFWDREQLDLALRFTENSAVTVDVKGEWCQGLIRYIGATKRKSTDPITGIYFGIELTVKDKGKRFFDGGYSVEKRFSNHKECDTFVPFTKVRSLDQNPPDSPKLLESPKPLKCLKPPEIPESQMAPVEALGVGDRVTFFMDDECWNGMVMDLQMDNNRTMVFISPDVNKKNSSAEPLWIPLEAVIREELLPPDPGVAAPVKPGRVAPSAGTTRGMGPQEHVSLNSVVEVDLGHGKTICGTVRWIGELPGVQGIRVGLELNEPNGVTDGTFQGSRLFSCLPKMGLFVKLDSCQPDPRFQTPGDGEGLRPASLAPKHTGPNLALKQTGPNLALKQTGLNLALKHTDPSLALKQIERNGELEGTVGGTVAPLTTEQVRKVLLGKMKGIQGHYNSCYMDSTLFGLFACSSVLDSLLFMATHRQEAAIQTTLLQQIVNPLRRYGFVPSCNVMKLRKQLQQEGYSDHTFATDEKDPEEFLTLVVQKILQLDPLLKLSTAEGKVQENSCYQIFLDQKHTLVLPTVQQLFEHSLHWSGLALAEIPSCLILQMPRFGKNFKMFDKIIPSLELDISDILSESPRECVLCGQLAGLECTDCFTDPTFGRTGFKLFCLTCSEKVHLHPTRKAHQPSRVRLPKGYPPQGARPPLPREKLQLFAVLCIETSHYVSFVRHGPRPRDWLFFDSMADREGDQDGYNIPRVQECPEVERYLQMSPAELACQLPREMEGVAKRLFCDASMYLYQSPSMCLYR